jgi:hypothetical protein
MKATKDKKLCYYIKEKCELHNRQYRWVTNSNRKIGNDYLYTWNPDCKNAGRQGINVDHNRSLIEECE